MSHALLVLIHPGAKEPDDLALRQRRQLFHDRVHDPVADMGCRLNWAIYSAWNV